MPNQDITGSAEDPGSIVRLLKNSRLFDQLSESELRKVSPLLSLQRFPESHVLSSEGEKNDQIYFLIKGTVSVYSKGELIMRLRRLGDMCGEFRVFMNKPDLASEIASTDVEVVSVDLGKLENDEALAAAEIEEVLFRLFSVMLIDKLAITTGRARQTQLVDKELSNSKQRLSDAFEQATKADQIKDYFLNNINHDLQTPTNGIVGITDLLLESGLGDQQLKYGRMIMRSAESLMKIVNSLMVFARHEIGQTDLNPQEFDLKELIDLAISRIESGGVDKGITVTSFIESQVPTALKGDVRRIQFVLDSLLENAQKFTREGQIKVSVELESLCRPRAEIKINVADTGIGIPAGFQDRIFDAFTQADTSLTRECAGIGLGLAICKKLVTLMGGTIGCTTEEGKGSEFWFSLPFEVVERITDGILAGGNAARTTEIPFVEQIREIGRASVLVVARDPVERLAITDMVRQLGFQVQSVELPAKALKILELTGIDVLIVDPLMPDIDGNGMTRLVRNSATANSKTRILALSSSLPGSEIDLSSDSGFDGILEKPITLEKLRHMIGEARKPNDFRQKGHGEVASEIAENPDATIVKTALDQLWENVGDYRPVIEQFLQECPQKIRNLEIAIKGGDLEEIRQAAMVLKTNFMIFGQVRVISLLDRILTLDRGGSFPELLTQVKSAGDGLIALLRTEIDKK